jgi:trehalose-6-phosphatase
MGAAFANACEVLGLANRLDPITVMVAKKIIELAQRGFRDSGDIERMALKELKPDSI